MDKLQDPQKQNDQIESNLDLHPTYLTQFLFLYSKRIIAFYLSLKGFLKIFQDQPGLSKQFPGKDTYADSFRYLWEGWEGFEIFLKQKMIALIKCTVYNRIQEFYSLNSFIEGQITRKNQQKLPEQSIDPYIIKYYLISGTFFRQYTFLQLSNLLFLKKEKKQNKKHQKFKWYNFELEQE